MASQNNAVELATLCRCSHCKKPRSEQAPMKTCARCKSAMYCSRECQKAAWVVHKLRCYARDENAHDAARHQVDVQLNGFRSIGKFSQVLRDFIEAHSWAFRHYVKAHALLAGDLDHANGPTKLLEIRLRSLTTRGSAINPAHPFELVASRWLTVAEHTSDPDCARIWQENARMREDAYNIYRRAPRFAGLLPVLWTVEHMATWTVQVRAYFSLHPDISRKFGEEQRNAIFIAAHTFCSSSINLGSALRCADGPGHIAALPGRYVRSNKRWLWEPLIMDWDQYLAGPRGIKEVDALLAMYFSEIPEELSVRAVLEIIRAS